MATVVADDSSLQADSQPKSGGLVWGSAAAWRCSTVINGVNSRNDLVVMMTALYMSSCVLLFLVTKHRLGRALFLHKNRFLALVLPNLNRSG